jgi:site-specific DNA recombinase
MIAGYCRLSRDEVSRESTSIEEQKSLIDNFAKTNNLIVDRFFVDDNFSGYSTTSENDTLFDRPAFLEMWNLILSGHIKMIIVKDLSRFGRKNAVAQILLERIKSIGCKCIDVNGNELLNDFTAIYGFVNEMHVKETSKKVRMTFANKQKSGQLLMGNSYFGYFRVGKTNLSINPEEAEVIRLIFDMYLNGNGYSKIANYLNENGYLTPSGYRNKQKQSDIPVSIKWQPAHLARILGNDLYCGVLTTHKYYVDGIKGKLKNYDKDQWYRHENHHEAIISKQDFDLVQNLRKKRNKNYRVKKHDYLFSGFGVCGQCGAPVSGILGIKHKQKTKGYNCVEYAKYGNKGCSNKHVYEFVLVDSLKVYLRNIKEKYNELLVGTQIEKKQSEVRKILETYKKQLQKSEQEYRSFQIRKNNELNSKDSFFHDIILKNYEIIEIPCLNEIKRLQTKIAELEQSDLLDMEEKIKNTLDIINDIISSDTIKRSFLERILDKIVFNEDRTIEFHLKIESFLADNSSMIFPAPAYKRYHRKISK